MTIKVAVIDDRREYLHALAKRLKEIKGVEVTSITEKDLLSTLDRLSLRRRVQRPDEDKESEPNEPFVIDEAEILLVDNDLAHLRGAGITSGEDVAYLARAYSTCGPIAVLNRFDHVFDLTMYDPIEGLGAVEHYLKEEDVDNAAIWGLEGSKRTGGQAFHPWHWPMLPDLLVRFQLMVEDVAAHEESITVADFLRLDDRTRDRLPREVEGQLGGPINEITLEDVCKQALESRDIQSNPQLRARIVAAKLHRWLNRRVLPIQDVFVDAPHLIPRMPSLLSSDVVSIENWDRLTRRGAIPADLGIDHLKLEPALYGKKHWFPTPVWLASEVEKLDIVEVRNPFKFTSIRYVFCEDLSRFIPRDDARPVATDIPGRFALRWIGLQNVDRYQPMRRLYL